mmetsp:Transcript_21360/g.64028  ORF Transcript_21360/g.64028 Transcript_21360/m.64028 type:complete len:354 (-) Transcript_21360:363-1424(-)
MESACIDAHSSSTTDSTISAGMPAGRRISALPTSMILPRMSCIICLRPEGLECGASGAPRGALSTTRMAGAGALTRLMGAGAATLPAALLRNLPMPAALVLPRLAAPDRPTPAAADALAATGCRAAAANALRVGAVLLAVPGGPASTATLCAWLMSRGTLPCDLRDSRRPRIAEKSRSSVDGGARDGSSSSSSSSEAATGHTSSAERTISGRPLSTSACCLRSSFLCFFMILRSAIGSSIAVYRSLICSESSSSSTSCQISATALSTACFLSSFCFFSARGVNVFASPIWRSADSTAIFEQSLPLTHRRRLMKSSLRGVLRIANRRSMSSQKRTPPYCHPASSVLSSIQIVQS